LIAPRANRHTLGVPVFDVEALEALVTDRFVVDANGIARVKPLRMRDERDHAQRGKQCSQAGDQFATSSPLFVGAASAIRLRKG
jgi:hypothetical protein